MLTHVRKIGNSLGNIIPATVTRSLNLKEGDKINIDTIDGKIIIEPVKSKHKLEDLIAKCNPKASLPKDVTEWDEMQATGKEIL